MRRILILGGAGFIGSSLCKTLLENNFQITVLDNLSLQIHGNNPDETSPLYQSIKGKVHFILGSVTSKSDLKKAMYNQEIIVQLSAETGTGQSMYQIRRYVEVNIVGTANMLDILMNTKHKVEKIIIASSRSVYGEGRYFSAELNSIVYPKQRVSTNMRKGDFEVKYPGCKQPLQLLPTNEESKLQPTSVYGITKLNQEQLIMTVCPTIGIAPVVFRYQNVYGPGQSLNNPYTGILSIFSTLIKSRNKINIFEDGKQSRDFIFIDDAVRATYLGITNDAANGEVFNVGTGIGTSVLTIAETLNKGYGSEVQLTISGDYRLGDIRHNFACLDKIKNKFDFSPDYSFDIGIKRFIEWVNEQEIMPSKYSKSIKEMEIRGILEKGHLRRCHDH